MKKFFKKSILVVIVATIVATSFVFANGVVKPRLFVRNDWVYIKEKGNYMHTTLYDDGTVVATKDKSFPSTFNGIEGYYATDQEGFMIRGYVLYNGSLYYFQPSGREMGKLLAGRSISFKGNIYEIDEYGRIQGDLKNFFDNATVYTMGLLKEE